MRTRERRGGAGRGRKEPKDVGGQLRGATTPAIVPAPWVSRGPPGVLPVSLPRGSAAHPPGAVGVPRWPCCCWGVSEVGWEGSGKLQGGTESSSWLPAPAAAAGEGGSCPLLAARSEAGTLLVARGKTWEVVAARGLPRLLLAGGSRPQQLPHRPLYGWDHPGTKTGRRAQWQRHRPVLSTGDPREGTLRARGRVCGTALTVPPHLRSSPFCLRLVCLHVRNEPARLRGYPRNFCHLRDTNLQNKIK